MADSEKITELIKKAQKGDVESFGTLIEDYEKFVFATSYKMLPNGEDAKDISQEVFIKAFKNIEKFDFNASFSTWLYRIAINTCIDEIRKRKGRETVSVDDEDDETGLKVQLTDTAGSAEEKVIRDETIREVRQAIEMLTEEHKAVIVLRDLQNLSYEEVAETLGIGTGTVKSRLARARKNLKDIIIKTREQNNNSNRQNSI